jgi:hypothetical protein
MPFEEIIRTGKILDNVDPKKLGRCKIQILPEFNGISKDFLDWSYPYGNSGGGFSKSGTHNVPEIGEYVKVIIRDKFWKKAEYITIDYVENNYPYSDFTNIISNIPELGSQTYPQPKYVQSYPDGSFSFYNSKTGERGLYHNSGAYFLIDANGKITIHNSKNMIINGADSGKVSLKNNSATLHSILKEVLTIIQNIITPGNLLGNMGAPVQYLQTGDLSTIAQDLTKLSQLLED